MTVTFPKHPRDIRVRVTQWELLDGMISGQSTSAEAALAEKLDHYLMRLGNSSVHIIGIATHLMVETKVRVNFRDYSERIELIDPEDKLSSAQAITLLDEYIEERKTDEDKERKHVTAKIVVQPSGSRE